MRRAVYAGTFDPITAGHVSVVERAAPMFDALTVLIAVNPAKRTLFDVAERSEMIREACARWPHVDVASTEGLVVEFARSVGAAYLVRGLRGTSDAEFETALAHMNHELAPDVATLFVPTRPDLAVVSSSTVKELARCGAPLGRFCPEGVARRLGARLARA